MRWVNKGHELDKIGFKFQHLNNIYLYGAGEYGRAAYDILKVSNINITFIDADVDKQKTGYCRCTVKSPQCLANLKEEKDRYVIIVTMGEQNSKIVSGNLHNMGFSRNQDFFSYDAWQNVYVFIFFWYYCSKIYIKNVDLSVTQYCNLRCKGCSILAPYVRHPKHRNLEDMKKDVELLFRNVDLLETLFLIGGEPVLYSELHSLCEFIGQNYREKIVHIVIATNGTVKMNENLLDIMLQYGIEVQISDYSLNVAGAHEKVDSLCNILTEKDIRFLRMTDFKWCDYGFLLEKCAEKSEDEMIHFFDACKIDCRGIEDGKFFYCFPAQMVYKALGIGVDSNLYLQMDENMNRNELFEFNMGYSEKGYMEMCRRCNGSYIVNKNYIAVAEQM